MAYIIQLHNIGNFDIGDELNVAFQKLDSMCDFVETNYWYLEHITCYDDDCSFVFEIERSDDDKHACQITDKHDNKIGFGPGSESTMMECIRDITGIPPLFVNEGE